MAAFTLVANTNVDALVGRTGGDTVAFAGFNLTMDENSRYGLNANTSAIWGTLTQSSTLGGDLFIDGRYVREIPFNTGSGTVPAYNTAITQGSASGLLIGVYVDRTVAPTTPGSAMPASGYLLIKQWNSVAYSAGALTGITANATGADVVGCIEIVGQESSFATISGFSQQGTNKVARGLPYIIGTTPGTPANTDTYQIPSNGNTVFMAGVFVENTPSVGDWEFWPTTSDAALITKIDTDQYRGRYCWVSSTGVLRFQNDGTNSTGGALPPANCRIAMGNVILNSATAAARTVNSMTATVNSRYRWAPAGLANVECEWITHNWRIGVSSAKKTNMANCGVYGPVSISQSGEQIVWTDSGVGGQLAENAIAFDFVSTVAGGIFTNVTFGRGAYTTNASYNVRVNACNNVEFHSCRFTFTGDKFSTASYALYLIVAYTVEIDSCTFGSNINTDRGSNYHIHDNSYYFSAYGLPSLTTNVLSIMNLATITDFIVEDELFPLAGQVPYGQLFNISVNTANGKIRNIGSYASPINGSGYGEVDAAYTRSSTTITVTTTSPHNVRVGDVILIYIADSSGAPVSQRLVTGVPTSTTFTFTGVNSGLTSGVISFYIGYFGNIVNITGNNVANIKFQNIWMTGHYSFPLALHATMSDIVFDNIGTDQRYTSHFGTLGTNTTFRSISGNSTLPTSQTAVLGTLMESTFSTPLTTTGQTAANWTRSSSTFTFSVPSHGFSRGGDYIQVFNSSDTTALPNGLYSPVAVTGGTFTIVGTASGGASGTADYRVTDARLNIFMNDESPATPFITINSGNPRFSGSGSLAALTIGDSVTWETPDWIYAFDNFANVLMTASSSTNIIQHMNFFYSLDRGAGYGSLQNLYYQRAGGGGSSASTNVTMTSTTGVNVNDYVYGIGIANGAKVQSITNSTTIVVTVANIGTVSGVLIFNQAPNEAQFPTTGIKMKVRFDNFGAPSAALGTIVVPMLSTATTRQNLYPQDVETVSFGLTNIATGSIVALYDSSDTELQREVVTDGTFDYQYVHSGVDTTGNYAVVWHEDYYTLKYDNLTFSTTDQSIFVVQELDLAYIPSSADISTFDYSNKIHVLDPTVSSGAQVDISLPQLYSNWKDNIALADNFTYDFAYVVVGGQTTFGSQSVSLYFFQDNGWKIRPKEINHTATLLDGILIAESGAPIVPTIGSYNVFLDYQKPEHALTIALSGALTPTDITDIASAVQTELNDDFDAIPTAAENASATASELNADLTSIMDDIANIASEQELPNLLIKDKLS